MVVLISYQIGESAFCVGDQRAGLLGAIRGQCQRGVGRSPPVGDGGLLEYVAEGVNLQSKAVRGAWIVRIAFVEVGDRLAGMSEEHGVAVAALRLQHPDSEVL